MKNITSVLASLVWMVAAGCSKGPTPEPCDGKPLAELAASLDKANGIGVDLSSKKVQTEIASAKAAVLGKKIALTGCMPNGQGNDIVSFGAASGAASIDCRMKGGENGVTEFRNAAQRFGSMSKLRVDVRGTVSEAGDRVGLTDCEMSVHD